MDRVERICLLVFVLFLCLLIEVDAQDRRAQEIESRARDAHAIFMVEWREECARCRQHGLEPPPIPSLATLREQIGADDDNPYSLFR